MLNLIIERGLLADQLDCFMQCGCSSENVKCQVILDKILYDLDRSIDLYAMGKDNFGQPERRAAAYSFVIEAFRDSQEAKLRANPVQTDCGLYKLANGDNLIPKDTVGIAARLEKIIDKHHLRPELDANNQTVSNVIDEIRNFANKLARNNPPQGLLRREGLCGNPSLCDEIQSASNTLNGSRTLDNLLVLYKKVQEAQVRLSEVDINVEMPRSVQGFLELFQQELCLQADTEARWENLVRTMAPNCAGMSEIFGTVSSVIQAAIDKVSVVECPELKPSIPPHFETSLDSMVDDVDRIGRGRPIPINFD